MEWMTLLVDSELDWEKMTGWKFQEIWLQFLSPIKTGIWCLLFVLFIVMGVRVGKKSKKKKMKRLRASSQLIAGIHISHDMQRFLEELAESGYSKLVVEVEVRGMFVQKVIYAIPSSRRYAVPLWTLIDKFNISYSVKASDMSADYARVQGISLLPGEYDLKSLPPVVPLLLTG